MRLDTVILSNEFKRILNDKKKQSLFDIKMRLNAFILRNEFKRVEAHFEQYACKTRLYMKRAQTRVLVEKH